eukprot:TRINITY_DN11775_c1_g1_i1.p1 TRINITY_DN11775_c1_g1~~TRINITY_DN11775_c1_g1_i1.p1  ORF type:complete len:2508 (+),score=543.80 TRINITY_DN11775_c1_g1_i1:622-7524(+)
MPPEGAPRLSLLLRHYCRPAGRVSAIGIAFRSFRLRRENSETLKAILDSLLAVQEASGADSEGLAMLRDAVQSTDVLRSPRRPTVAEQQGGEADLAVLPLADSSCSSMSSRGRAAGRVHVDGVPAVLSVLSPTTAAPAARPAMAAGAGLQCLLTARTEHHSLTQLGQAAGVLHLGYASAVDLLVVAGGWDPRLLMLQAAATHPQDEQRAAEPAAAQAAAVQPPEPMQPAPVQPLQPAQSTPAGAQPEKSPQPPVQTDVPQQPGVPPRRRELAAVGDLVWLRAVRRTHPEASFAAMLLRAAQHGRYARLQQLLRAGRTLPARPLSLLGAAAGVGHALPVCPYAELLLRAAGQSAPLQMADCLSAAMTLPRLPHLAVVATRKYAYRRPHLAAVAASAAAAPPATRTRWLRHVDAALQAAHCSSLRRPSVPRVRALLAAASRPQKVSTRLIGCVAAAAGARPPRLLQVLRAAAGGKPVLGQRHFVGLLATAAARPRPGGQQPPQLDNLAALMEAGQRRVFPCIRRLLLTWGSAAPGARVAMWPSPAYTHTVPLLRILGAACGEARLRRRHPFLKLLAEARPRMLLPGMRARTPEGSGVLVSRVSAATPEWGRHPDLYGGWVVLLDSGALAYCAYADATADPAPRRVRLLAQSSAPPAPAKGPSDTPLLAVCGELSDAASLTAVTAPLRRATGPELMAALASSRTGQLTAALTDRPPSPLMQQQRTRTVRILLQRAGPHGRVGITLQRDAAVVATVDTDSAAHRSGVLPGMRLLRIQGVSVAGRAEAVAALCSAPTVLSADVIVPRSWQRPMHWNRALQAVAGPDCGRSHLLLQAAAGLAPVNRYRMLRRLLRSSAVKGLRTMRCCTSAGLGGLRAVIELGSRPLLGVLARTAGCGDLAPLPPAWPERSAVGDSLAGSAAPSATVRTSTELRPLQLLSSLLPSTGAVSALARMPRPTGHGVDALCLAVGAALPHRAGILLLLRVRAPRIAAAAPYRGLSALAAVQLPHHVGIAAVDVAAGRRPAVGLAMAVQQAPEGEQWPSRAATPAAHAKRPSSDHETAPLYIRCLASACLPPISAPPAGTPDNAPLLSALQTGAPFSLVRAAAAPALQVGARVRVRDAGREWLHGTVTERTADGYTVLADGFKRAWVWDEMDAEPSAPPLLTSLWESAMRTEPGARLLPLLPHLRAGGAGEPPPTPHKVLALAAVAGIDLAALPPVMLPYEPPATPLLLAEPPAPPPQPRFVPRDGWLSLLGRAAHSCPWWERRRLPLIISDLPPPPVGAALQLFTDCFAYPRRDCSGLLRCLALSHPAAAEAAWQRPPHHRRGWSPRRSIVEPPRPEAETRRLSELCWTQHWDQHGKLLVSELYARKALRRLYRVEGLPRWHVFTAQRAERTEAAEAVERAAVGTAAFTVALTAAEGTARVLLRNRALILRAAMVRAAAGVWEPEECCGRAEINNDEYARRRLLLEAASADRWQLDALRRAAAAVVLQRLARCTASRVRRRALRWRRQAREAWEVRWFRDEEVALRRRVRCAMEEREEGWMEIAEQRSVEVAMLTRAPVTPRLRGEPKARSSIAQQESTAWSELSGLARLSAGRQLRTMLPHHEKRETAARRFVEQNEMAIVEAEVLGPERASFLSLMAAARARRALSASLCSDEEPAARELLSTEEEAERAALPPLPPPPGDVNELRDHAMLQWISSAQTSGRQLEAAEEERHRAAVVGLMDAWRARLLNRADLGRIAVRELLAVIDTERRSRAILMRRLTEGRIEIETTESPRLVRRRRATEATRRPIGGRMVTLVLQLVDAESSARQSYLREEEEGRVDTVRRRDTVPSPQGFMRAVLALPFENREERQRTGIADAEAACRALCETLAAPLHRREPSAAYNCLEIPDSVMEHRKQYIMSQEESERTATDRAERKARRQLGTSELRARPPNRPSAVAGGSGVAAVRQRSSAVPAVPPPPLARTQAWQAPEGGGVNALPPPVSVEEDAEPPNERAPKVYAGIGPVGAYLRRAGVRPSPEMLRRMRPAEAALALQQTARPPPGGRLPGLSATAPGPDTNVPDRLAASVPARLSSVLPSHPSVTTAPPAAQVDSPLLRTLLRVPKPMAEQRKENERVAARNLGVPSATVRDIRRSQTDSATLDADGLGWGDAELRPYLLAMATNTSVSVLRLGGNRIGATSAELIAGVLRRPTCRLRLLSFRDCGLTEQAARTILLSVRKQESVAGCDMTGNADVPASLLLEVDAMLARRALARAAAITGRRGGDGPGPRIGDPKVVGSCTAEEAQAEPTADQRRAADAAA